MAHGSASNFIRQTVGSAVGTTDPETIDVADASAFPDPSTSQYDIVIWDAGSFNRPDQDSNVEVLTVTVRDTGNNTLTCARAQQGTTNTSHPNTSDVIVAPLSVGDFNTVRTIDGTINGAQLVGQPVSSTDQSSTGFDTWRTPSSEYVTFVAISAQAETDGSTNGTIVIDVDESGGTSQDYFLYVAVAHSNLGDGGQARGNATVLVPPGASYQLRNAGDPNNNSLINNWREYTP